MSAFEAITDVFKGITAIIALLKQTKDLLPDDAKKKAVEQSLEEVEKKSKLAEAQVAQALGYRLCRCTFPPQIMLRIGRQQNVEAFRCPICGNTWPPPDTGQVEFVEDFDP